MLGKPRPPPVAALMEQFGMTEADILTLAMSSPRGLHLPHQV